MSGQVRRFAGTSDLVSAAIDEVLRSDLSRGVALTGGRVGTEVSLALIAALESTRAAHSGTGGSWTGPVRLWFSDERFLQLGDPDRNDTPVLARTASAPESARAVTVESVLGPEASPSADAAARDYEQRLRAVGVPQVAIVSIGPDGHVASVFPHHALLRETAAGVRSISDSPKPPPTRVTWTVPLLMQCPRLLLLAAGADKDDAVQAVLAGDESLPATRLLGPNASLFIA